MILGLRSSVLEERPFRLLFFARLSSVAGDALIPVALVFAVLDVGGGASGLGLVLALFAISRVVFTLVGGVVADRLPRRLVMVVCDLVRAAVNFFTAAALLTGVMELWMFLVTSAVFGAASAFFGPASTGIVPATVSAERLQQANALLGMTRRLADIFAPLLSGLLVAAAGPGWVFALDASSFVVSAALLLALRVGERAREEARSFLADLGEGWREVRSRSWLWASFIAFALSNMAIAPFLVLGPVIAERDLGGATAWGLILTGGALGGVLGGVVAYRIRPGRPLVAAFSIWVLGSLPPLALIPPLPALAIALANAAFVFGIAFGNAIWETVLQERIPRDRLGRVSAYDWLVSLLFMPFGLALTGPAAEAFGTVPTLVVAACAVVVVNVGTLVVAPAVRKMQRTPPPDPEPVIGESGASPVVAPRGSIRQAPR